MFRRRDRFQQGMLGDETTSAPEKVNPTERRIGFTPCRNPAELFPRERSASVSPILSCPAPFMPQTPLRRLSMKSNYSCSITLKRATRKKRHRRGRPQRWQEMVIRCGAVESEEMSISLSRMSVWQHSSRLSFFFSFSSWVASYVFSIQTHGILDRSVSV